MLQMTAHFVLFARLPSGDLDDKVN